MRDSFHSVFLLYFFAGGREHDKIVENTIEDLKQSKLLAYGLN